MVKIEAFVEVSARRLRSLQPTCPHGISIGKNCDENKKSILKLFYKRTFTVISNGKLTINGKLSLIAKLSK